MHISEFFDLSVLDQIISDWSVATKMVAAALDGDGAYISNISGYVSSDEDYFSVDIIVNNECLGSLVGKPEDEDLDEEAVDAAVRILEETINTLIKFEYTQKKYERILSALESEIDGSVELIKELNSKSLGLKKIESKQNILALNASIEAARAGEAGKGFTVVAHEFGKMAHESGEINDSIQKTLQKLSVSIRKLGEEKDNL